MINRNTYALCIRQNNIATHFACFICGGIAEPSVPYAAFTDKGRDVCDQCITQHAPELHEALHTLNCQWDYEKNTRKRTVYTSTQNGVTEQKVTDGNGNVAYIYPNVSMGAD